MAKAPAPIVKTYPPRGPLQQFRFGQSVVFTCFRCGQDKTSKLITIYGSDWRLRLCNGCHGRLVSIYDIKAGTAPTKQRAKQLAQLLFKLADADSARAALRLSRIASNPTEVLTDQTQRCLGTSEFVAAHLMGELNIEWSPAIIALGSLTEIAPVDGIPIAQQARTGAPGCCLDQLAPDPSGRRAGRHVHMHQLAPATGDEHQHVQRLEP
jgi:hypothetical protein